MIFRVHSPGGLLFLLCSGTAALTLLHMVLLFCCIHLKENALHHSRRRFTPQSWEQNGLLYRERLKIHLWKDKVPQHIGKEGFSKARLNKQLSPDYLDAFLAETCRGEWYHTACLSGVPLITLILPLPWSLFFSVPMGMIHMACIAIQRYNRIRLLAVRKKISRSPQRDCGTTCPESAEP